MNSILYNYSDLRGKSLFYDNLPFKQQNPQMTTFDTRRLTFQTKNSVQKSLKISIFQFSFKFSMNVWCAENFGALTVMTHLWQNSEKMVFRQSGLIRRSFREFRQQKTSLRNSVHNFCIFNNFSSISSSEIVYLKFFTKILW